MYCGNCSSVEFDEQARQVIAGAIKARRASLGLSQEQAARASGGLISTANLRIFEGAGRPAFRDKSLLGVARALSWPADAVARIAAGADPASLPTVTGATPVSDVAASAGGVELATSAQVAELQRQLDGHQRVIDDLARRLARLDGVAPDAAFLTAAHDGPDTPMPDGDRRSSRARVESFDPDA